ncbi:hypothetical protein, variant [Aphanomyces invadans]|nr:hypothetical protein, variant [Aphanomyces invadans]ETV97510.1 hypothetical protein, variant [Aphanomyces invadans]|eukprot:XP_008873719.1 hypothetical protein, variant [Aphanomyces invadans]
MWGLRRVVVAAARGGRRRARQLSMDAFLAFERELARKKRSVSPPPRPRRLEPPTPPRDGECCNLNCPNCVLLVYHEQLLEYEDSVRWEEGTSVKETGTCDRPTPSDVTLTWASPAEALAWGAHGPWVRPPRGVSPSRVVANRVLTTTPHRSVHHIQVEHAPEMYHTAGNWNAYVPNADTVVSRCLDRLSLPPGADASTAVVQINPGHTKSYPIHEWLSLTSLLTWYVDLMSPPTPRTLRRLSALATAPTEQTRLIDLAADTSRSLSSFADVLDDFPSIVLSAEACLSLAPPLLPRSYTIASSSKQDPTTIALTVAVKAPPLHGRCSTHLASSRPHACRIYGAAAPSSFSEHWRAHFPPSTPQLWIATGTGIAPFRGLLEELSHVEKRPPVALYYGCRNPSDELYHNELTGALAQRVLQSYTPVYSHTPPSSHSPSLPWHVGDKLKQDAAAIFNYLEHGTVYVCGSMAMGRDVNRALVDCLTSQRGWTADRAKTYLKTLQVAGRYVAEVW